MPSFVDLPSHAVSHSLIGLSVPPVPGKEGPWLHRRQIRLPESSGWGQPAEAQLFWAAPFSAVRRGTTYKYDPGLSANTLSPAP